MPKVVYLVKVESNANNNKFYRMIENGDSFEAQYGRIGNTGYQTKIYPISRWNSTYNSKLKKGYEDKTELVATKVVEKGDKQYKEIDSKVIAEIVKRLQSMARKAISDNYTISSQNVTQKMIDEAQELLNELLSKDKVDEFNEILLELFKTIPRKMSKVSLYLADNKKQFGDIIQNEQDLLDVMKGQVVTQDVEDEDEGDGIEKVDKTILEVLGLEFEEVDDEDIKLIKNQLGEIKDKFHRAWKVKNIKTQAKYDKFIEENNIKDTKLLWHGSRNENWWSIINTGLVLRPQAKITGKMFGHGIYFAPKARKSLGYTSLDGSYWVGGSSESAFMALNEVAYGKPYDVYNFDSKFYSYNYESLRRDCSDANCLHAHEGRMLRNDEIIVYKEEQLTIKYLVEIK
jgi:poly [ADP-ribose] polymerase 2/3/4